VNLVLTRITGDQLLVAWGPGCRVSEAGGYRLLTLLNGDEEQVTNTLAAIIAAVGATVVP
jgi:hypothetical protein